MDDQQISQNILHSIESKYEETVHIPLLIEVLSRMEGIEAFCADAGISKKTFYVWLERYPRLKEAYEIGLPRGERKWVTIPFTPKGRHINVNAWRLLGQNRYSFGKPRFMVPSGTDFASKCLALHEAFHRGDIGPQDYNTALSAYVTELKGKILDRSLEKETDSGDVNILNMNENELVDYLLASKT